MYQAVGSVETSHYQSDPLLKLFTEQLTEVKKGLTEVKKGLAEAKQGLEKETMERKDDGRKARQDNMRLESQIASLADELRGLVVY